MLQAAYVHEKSYAKSYLGGSVHRARLKAVGEILRRHAGATLSSWADFGCSNGFVIESVLKDGRFDFARIVGYDHSQELLEKATARHIRNATFSHRDMNQPPPADSSAHSFEVVTCLETLEHVADYRRSFEHLYVAAKPGGVIVVAVPNETGIPGFVKLWGRYAARRKPYGDFFEGSSLSEYVKRLITGSGIQEFRRPTTKGYGPHLGFDYRMLIQHIDETYVRSGQLSLVERATTFFGMNVVLVYRVSSGA